MDLDKLRSHHEKNREKILERLEEFSSLKHADNDKLFEELCFCVLTANTSAKMSMNSIDKTRHILKTATKEELAKELKGIYRFPNIRSEYIVHNRDWLQEHDFQIRKMLQEFREPKDKREFLVEKVKGLGYKESSHFLRNIGHKGLAILDKHIINSLAELGVIEEARRPRNRKEYLEIEEKMIEFCNEAGIDPDEMDLALWSMKTGEILK